MRKSTVGDTGEVAVEFTARNYATDQAVPATTGIVSVECVVRKPSATDGAETVVTCYRPVPVDRPSLWLAQFALTESGVWRGRTNAKNAQGKVIASEPWTLSVADVQFPLTAGEVLP